MESAIVNEGIPERARVTFSDNFLEYTVEDNKKVVFTPAVKKEHLAEAKRHAQMQKTAQGLTKNKSINYSEPKRDYVVVDVGTTLNPTKVVQVEDKHKPPRYSISLGGDSATVQVGSDKIGISPESKKEIELPAQTVKVRIPGDEFEERQDPRVPSETTLVRTGSQIEEVQITPTLIVRNHGEVDIQTPNKTIWD